MRRSASAKLGSFSIGGHSGVISIISALIVAWRQGSMSATRGQLHSKTVSERCGRRVCSTWSSLSYHAQNGMRSGVAVGSPSRMSKRALIPCWLRSSSIISRSALWAGWLEGMRRNVRSSARASAACAPSTTIARTGSGWRPVAPTSPKRDLPLIRTCIVVTQIASPLRNSLFLGVVDRC